MTTQILNIAFGETPVSFRADGFLNATAIAKHFGKVAKDYLKTEQTKEYIKALAEYLSNGMKILVEVKQLVIVKNGAPETGGGTWLHPKLAIHFARWLDPKFAVWCDFQIEKILGINQEQATDRLTDEQVGYLYNQVMRICGETGQAYQTVFGGLKRHFQVASYKHIKASDFAQACKWLGVPLPMETKEQPKGILMSEEQVYQLSTLTRYAQRMSLDFEHIAPALDRLDSKLAGRAYSWGVEPNHWICCIQRFLMQATKQMTNPKYIEGVRDNFVHMI